SIGAFDAVLTGSSMDAQDRTGLFGTQRFEASTRASRGLSTARPFLQNFVRQDVHRLRVGVEPPVEPEAFAPLVLGRGRQSNSGLLARETGSEHGPALLGRLHLERAAVPGHDGAGYEKAQPEAGGSTVSRAGGWGGHLDQGVEDHLQGVVVNRGAIVLHPHADRVGLAARLENYRQTPGAVLNRVVQKIREDLLQAGAVESAAQVARHLEAEDVIRMSRLHLVERRFAGAGDAAGLQGDRNPPPQPRSG